jgi:hypothetical protein
MVDYRQTHNCDLHGVNLDFDAIVQNINRDALASYNDVVRLIQSVDISDAQLQIQGALDSLDAFLKGSIYGGLEALTTTLGIPKMTKPTSRGFGSGGKTAGDPGGSDNVSSAVVRRGTSVGVGDLNGASVVASDGSSVSASSVSAGGKAFPRPSISQENDNERLSALGVANCFGTVFADSGDDNFKAYRQLYMAVGRDYSKLQEITRAMRSGEHLIVYSQITIIQFKPLGGNRQELPAIEARLGFKLQPQEVWWDDKNIAYVPVKSYINHNAPLWKIAETHDMAEVEISVFSIDYVPATTGVISRFLNLGFQGQMLQAIISETDLLEFELDRVLQYLYRSYNGVPANMSDVVMSIKSAQQLINMRVSSIPDRELIGALEGRFGAERVKYLLDWRADLAGINMTMQSTDLLRYLNQRVKTRPGSTKISNSVRDRPFDFIGKAQAMAHVCRRSAIATQAQTTDDNTSETKLRIFLLIAYLGGLVLAEKMTPLLTPSTAEMLSYFVDKSTRSVYGSAATAPGVSTNVSTLVKTDYASATDALGTTTSSSRSEVTPGVTQIVDTVITVSASGSKTTSTTTTTVKTQDGTTLTDATLDSIMGAQDSAALTGASADGNAKSFGSSLGDGQMIMGGQKSFDSPAALLVRSIDLDASFGFTIKLIELASIPLSDLDIYGEYAALVDKALKATAAILQATCGRMQSLIKMVFDSWGDMFRDLETLLSASASLTIPGVPACLFSASFDLNAKFLLDLARQALNSVISFLSGFNGLVSSIVAMLCQASCMLTSLLGADIPQLPCLQTLTLPNPVDELIQQIQSICMFGVELMQKAGGASSLLRTEISILPDRIAVLDISSSCPCSTYGLNTISEALSSIPKSISAVIPVPKGTPYPLPL